MNVSMRSHGVSIKMSAIDHPPIAEIDHGGLRSSITHRSDHRSPIDHRSISYGGVLRTPMIDALCDRLTLCSRPGTYGHAA